MGDSFRRLLAGIAYIVWRATTGRPAFVHQADSLQVQILFLVVLLLSSFFIHLSSWFNFSGLVMAIDTFVGGVLMVMVACSGIKSRLPFINGLACMVGLAYVDGAFWLVCDAVQAFDPGTENDMPLRPLLIVLAIACFKFYMAIQIKDRFLKLPAAIQKPGYRPTTFESDLK